MRQVKLQDVAAPIKNAIVDGPFGSNLKLVDYVEQGVPVLQGKNITNDRFKWFDVRFISNEKAEELGRSKVREGDLLIIKIGSIGYSAIIDDLNGFPFAVIPANLAKVTLNEEIVFPKFIAQYLVSPQAKRKLVSLASKTAQPALSLTKIKELSVPLPPLPIQKQIAAILEKADAAREKRRQANQLTEQFLQSAFLEMFGDPVTNPKGWDITNIGEIASHVSSGSTPLGGESTYLPVGVPFIRSQNVRMNALDLSDVAHISNEVHENMKRSWVKNGDVLLNITGASIGRVSSYKGPDNSANVNQHVCIIRTIQTKANPVYISFLISMPSFQSVILSRNSGATRQAFNFEQVRSFRINLSPISEQQKFAALVEKVEGLRAKQRESEKELENLFQSLMQRAFKGELVG